MSKKQTERIAELEAKVMVYEEIIRKSSFSVFVPQKDEIGFKVSKEENEKRRS